MKLTYQQLESKLSETQQELSETQQEITKTKLKLSNIEELLKLALTKIQELEDKLNTNSNNSSKPPSTDEKGNTSKNACKKRKSRKGASRTPFSPDRVDKKMDCKLESCPHCNRASSLQMLSLTALQQVELPKVRAIVTEYLLHKYRCRSCKKTSTGALPEGVGYTAFGPNLMGLLATLTGVFHLAKREAIELIKDLYDIDIGLGSIPNVEERVAHALDPVYGSIHEFVLKSEFCKHFDETGWRNSGKRHYAWLACCKHAAYYRIDRFRNSAAFQKLIGDNTTNIPSVTDRYAVYNAIEGPHQYCLAHLIREFRKYSERDGPDKPIGAILEKGLQKACKLHREYREGLISCEKRNRRLRYCKRSVKTGLEDGMANGSDKFFRLCENLLDKFGKLWTFIEIEGMEPTNNLAERDMRKLVIWRKKSYGTRSERGKAFVERISTVAQSLRRQKKNVLTFIQQSVVAYYSSGKSPFISVEMGF